MIVLVWSLVSSVVELNRRRKLALFLRQFFADANNNAAMLVCRRNGVPQRELSDLPNDPFSNGRGKLSRFTSEPHLAGGSKIIYRNEKAEVVVEPVTSLHPSEWRFVPSLATDELQNTIFFVIVAGRNEQPADELPACTVFLESSCERVAWHRLHPSSLYRCSLETFTDIVYAFSEGALFENSTIAIVETLNTVTRPGELVVPSDDRASTSSICSSNSQISQKPMPLLQQLFWGDSQTLESAKQRFASEAVLSKGNGSGGAVHGQFGSLPRRLHSSPRRRYRSCTYGSPRNRASPTFTQSLYCDIPLQTANFFDPTSQLPPYIRILEKEANGENRHSVSLTASCLAWKHKPDKTDMSSQGSISPSITIDEMNDMSTNQRSDDELAEIPYVDDIPSPQPIVESSAYAMVISRKKNVNFEDGSPRNDDVDEITYMDAETPSCSTPPPFPPPYTQEDEQKKIKQNETVENKETNGEKAANGNDSIEKNHITVIIEENGGENGSGVKKQETKPPGGRKPVKKPPLPVKINGAVRSEAEQIIEAAAKVSSFRRHSVMLLAAGNELTYNGSVRHRSLSPSPFDDYCRQSMKRRGSRDVSTFARDSVRRPYTPTRNFLSTRSSSSAPAMSKPQSILVYTADKTDLYSRIRDGLSTVIPRDVYTVFNISAEALRGQPWIEPTTTCLIIAETSGLDDASWAKMQSYFNQSGKIIFVCQNELLTSLTSSDSSKKKSNILKVAFGKRDSVTMDKDFEQFLKKSLKSLEKGGQINESFRSKDLASGTSYTVILKKDKDRPLFLFMENNAHQASAIFSDATADQLLAPDSKILPESLSRIGVAVSNTSLPPYTNGIMCSQPGNKMNDMKGFRYGVEIGLKPKLFLRTEDMFGVEKLPIASDSLLPIQVGLKNLSSYAEYDFDRYFETLRTSRFGRMCLYVPVTTTTMDLCDSLNDAIPSVDDGMTVVAGLQTAGKGRGGNEFISPRGACMFTFSFRLPRGFALSSNPSFIQHIFAVSLVDAINTLSGMDDFPVKIKWPNDFYFNRSHKIGGMLATARTRDDSLLVTIGAGINVSNSLPTLCLNDIVPDGSGIHFYTEEIVAETLNKFEYWIKKYETDKSEFLNKYYEYWLHNREEVFVEELGEKVVIRGLDKYGYLEVRSKNNPNKLFSVGDDGNTFDMMKGLIRHKI